MDIGVRSAISGRHSMHIRDVKGRMGINVAVGVIRTRRFMMGYAIEGILLSVVFDMIMLHRLIMS